MKRGFTLLEVMIALLILAVSLAVLLQAQAGSLANSSRARDMTVATLLARSKMIDIEQVVFDEGFVDGEQVEKGDFDDEGYPKIKWSYRIAEVDLDVSLLGDLCGDFSGGDGGLDGGEGCEGFIGGLGGLIEPVTQNIANSVRLVQLDIEWPTGKYKDGFSIKTLLTRDGFTFAGATPGTPAPGANASNANSNASSNSAANPGGAPGTAVPRGPEGF